jgi:hypothetical protein
MVLSKSFEEGFECPPNTAPATFLKWSSRRGASIIQSSIKHSGTYAMRCETANDGLQKWLKTGTICQVRIR